MAVNPVNTESLDSSTIEAQINPYVLHHSTATTTSLVTELLVGADNYISWSKAMMIALSGRNKLGFINGKIKKPESGNLLTAWQCNNDVVTSWIINSISKRIAVSLVYTGYAKDLWEELKERYRQTNGPRIFQLRKQFVKGQ